MTLCYCTDCGTPNAKTRAMFRAPLCAACALERVAFLAEVHGDEIPEPAPGEEPAWEVELVEAPAPEAAEAAEDINF